MTAHPVLEQAWRATLHVEQTPSAWLVSATAGPSDVDALYADDLEVDDHAWWLGVRSGDRERWYASSAGHTGNAFIDDTPGVDALWLSAGAVAVEVLLWIRLANADGAGTPRSFRARCELADPGHYDVALEPAAVALPPIAPDVFAPPVVLAVARGDGIPRAVVPGVGVLEDRYGEWTLSMPAGRVPLPGFAPARDARAEAFTPGPDGHLAVVWSMQGGWHLALYQLPAPAPRVVIPPRPSANGNTPHPGTFASDARSALLPVVYDELGVIDVARGVVLHRLPAGGPVSYVAGALDGDVAWLVGHGRARAFALADGGVGEDHACASRYGVELAFSPMARRLAWVEVYDYDEPTSAVLWHDLDGGLGQVLLADALAYPPHVLPAGDLVVWGRQGLWYVDPARGVVQRVSDTLAGTSALPVVERIGAQLVAWTADPDAFRLELDTGPRGPGTP